MAHDPKKNKKKEKNIFQEEETLNVLQESSYISEWTQDFPLSGSMLSSSLISLNGQSISIADPVLFQVVANFSLSCLEYLV